jgi:hypothetical protein
MLEETVQVHILPETVELIQVAVLVVITGTARTAKMVSVVPVL